MKKIKAMLIHLLGGVTEEEIQAISMDFASVMELKRVAIIRKYLDLMNGAQPDDWCKQAYAYIERIEGELHAECKERNINVKIEFELNNENEN